MNFVAASCGVSKYEPLLVHVGGAVFAEAMRLTCVGPLGFFPIDEENTSRAAQIAA